MLVTRMSTEIVHLILAKKKLNKTNELWLTIDFWTNRQMASLFISFQIKNYTILRWLADNPMVITHLETL